MAWKNNACAKCGKTLGCMVYSIEVDGKEASGCRACAIVYRAMRRKTIEDKVLQLTAWW